MPPLTPLLALLSTCADPLRAADIPGFTRGERDPSVELGALADDPDDPTTLGVIDPALLSTCEQQTVGIMAVGPRIHDPQDPYTLMTITMQATIPGEAAEGTDAQLCNFACSLSTTDCWLSRTTACEPIEDQAMPVSFGATTEVPGHLVLCVQATGASKLPLHETVEIKLNDQPGKIRHWVITGPRP